MSRRPRARRLLRRYRTEDEARAEIASSKRARCTALAGRPGTTTRDSWCARRGRDGLRAPRLPKRAMRTREDRDPSERARPWDSCAVEVAFEGTPDSKGAEYVRATRCSIVRAFRQGGATTLISPNYTRTAVIDLAPHIIAEGPKTAGERLLSRWLLVPDWWDVNDGSIIPEARAGTRIWSGRAATLFGGDVTGETNSLKVQHLDCAGSGRGS